GGDVEVVARQGRGGRRSRLADDGGHGDAFGSVVVVGDDEGDYDGYHEERAEDRGHVRPRVRALRLGDDDLVDHRDAARGDDTVGRLGESGQLGADRLGRGGAARWGP